MLKNNIVLALRKRDYCPFTKEFPGGDSASESYYDYESVKGKRTEFGAIVPDWIDTE